MTRLRFRVIDITTLGSAVITPPQAQLKVITSGDVTVMTGLSAVTVKGTTLEQPPRKAWVGTQQQPGGGVARRRTGRRSEPGCAVGDGGGAERALPLLRHR